jgi:glycosyltransferase involved in cell wall biosynthesis
LKKISIIGTNGLPANYGGWETLVDHLTLKLNQDFKITVYCSSHSYDKEITTINGVDLKYVGLKANGWQSIPYDIVSMFRSFKKDDVLLILGVSGCIVLPLLKLLGNNFIVVNIDGLEWKRAKWNGFIKKFLKLSEFFAVRYADCVVSDNKVIQAYIASEYNKKSKLVPYGADQAKPVSLTKALIEQFKFLKGEYAFKVCRIEPENNLDMILQAFVENPLISLVIVGNWNKSEYGIALKSRYARFDNLYLLDPIYELDRLNQLRSNCIFYVHGHSAGGTNPSLVEAMYLGLPILAFGINFNRETTYHQAIYFSTAAELTQLLVDIKSLNLKAVGIQMKIIAKEHYTWQVVSDKYKAIFLSV